MCCKQGPLDDEGPPYPDPPEHPQIYQIRQDLRLIWQELRCQWNKKEGTLTKCA